MLPQPDTICQLPYSVEREEPERVFSAANLQGHSDIDISILEQKETKVLATFSQMDGNKMKEQTLVWMSFSPSK